MYYDWQRIVTDNLAAALAPAGDQAAQSRERKLARQNEALKARLADKDNVIAEVAAEMVKLKKELGEL